MFSIDKGISPLIAAVLLIAFVIGVGALIGNFFIDFAGEHTEDAIERGGDDINCMYSDLELRSSCFIEEEGEEIVFEMENSGTVDLSDFMIRVHHGLQVDVVNVTNSNITLEEGRANYFMSEGLEDTTEVDDIDSIDFFSEWCPDRTTVTVDTRNVDAC